MAFGRLTFSPEFHSLLGGVLGVVGQTGSTSMETAAVDEVGSLSDLKRKMSAALRTSVVVSSRTAVSTSTLPSSLS